MNRSGWRGGGVVVVVRERRPRSQTRTCSLCGESLWVGDLFDALPEAEATQRADYVLGRHEQVCAYLTEAALVDVTD